MAGHLPPGCTQRECDMAQPGYWDEPHDEEPELAQCDCCAKMVPADTIWHGVAYGIETFACEECSS
jgi:hypothetical protein